MSDGRFAGVVMAAVLASAPALGDGALEFDRLERLAFNRRAAELDQPVFWRADANGNRTLDPDELVVTWRPAPLARTELVDGKNTFTPKFRGIYERMLRADDTKALGPAEKQRREAVRLELSQGRPTLVESDFSGANEAEKRLVAHLLRVAVRIEHLYARQRGTAGVDRAIPPDDTASAAMFFRNQGPFCEAPLTEKNPACRASPEPVKPIFGIYPADLQSDKSFCAVVQAQKNAAELTGHFSSVVRGDAPNVFLSVSYSVAYKDDMEAVAVELEAAAAQLGTDEAALKTYLRAAARAFRDDSWALADQAWAAMGDGHSKYYLRIGPDEVYFEPCGWKAAFAMAFARINQDSLEWRRRLEPMKQDMEDKLARLAGKPYRARRVAFKLPDFIDVVLNAGNNRMPLGCALGQSLPNWGPLAEKGGRTMIMSNLGIDADSRSAMTARLSSLYCPSTMSRVSVDPKLDIMATVLHEAAHNLGPTREHKVGGKVDQAIFGGPLALMLEELKAETAANDFSAMLVERKLVTQSDADLANLFETGVALGAVADGTSDAEGRPKPYGQLALIQLGALRRVGALEWKAGETAGNGADRGCFELHRDKWQAAVVPLAKTVLQIKSRGDRRGAERLVKQVEDDGEWKTLREIITKRWYRQPRGTFVYAVGGL